MYYRLLSYVCVAVKPELTIFKLSSFYNTVMHKQVSACSTSSWSKSVYHHDPLIGAAHVHLNKQKEFKSASKNSKAVKKVQPCKAVRIPKKYSCMQRTGTCSTADMQNQHRSKR